MNILLIGLRCSGKTTVGRDVAARLGRVFVDLDDVTPEVLGVSDVREAWDRFGEPAFRRAETVALARELSKQGRVVALGGGTPTAELAAELIESERSRGAVKVFYLRAAASVLQERLRAADRRNRPTLTVGDPIAEVPRVLAARDPLYTRLADHVLDANDKSPGEIAEALMALC